MYAFFSVSPKDLRGPDRLALPSLHFEALSAILGTRERFGPLAYGSASLHYPSPDPSTPARSMSRVFFRSGSFGYQRFNLEVELKTDPTRDRARERFTDLCASLGMGHF